MSIPKNLTKQFHPRCATCGHQDCFEHNEDMTYIKCTTCGREYFGGQDELMEYNSEELEAFKEDMFNENRDMLQKEILKKLKKIK